VASEGHEVAPHGFDHVGWQDGVQRWDAARIRADMAAAVGAFEAVFGTRPEASAAPGWRTTPEALAVQEEFGFRYASDVRGRAPFRPVVAAGPLKTLQIPTSMPTLDELLGAVPDVVSALEGAMRPGLNVLAVHAEVEGGWLLDTFERFLRRLRGRGAAITRLGEAATQACVAADPPPLLPVGRARARGRSGWVATHGPVGYPA
jgi:peptidoglycan/xylan/chitin deacetylase (PgdA/CDA1 family)